MTDPEVLFVVDGTADSRPIPCLVRAVLDVPFRATLLDTWRRLHHDRSPGRPNIGKLGRKLLAAIREARDRGAAGVVATADHDKGQEDRLGKLRNARQYDRSRNTPIPTAVGVAKPHAEAWLLDDAVAVRQTLNLAPETRIPKPTRAEPPKATLNGLISQSPRASENRADLLAEIAAAVVPHRYGHPKQTGFAAFEKDVRSELDALAAEIGRC